MGKPTICCEKKCVLKQTVKNFEEKLFLRSFKFEIHGCQQNLTIDLRIFFLDSLIPKDAVVQSSSISCGDCTKSERCSHHSGARRGHQKAGKGPRRLVKTIDKYETVTFW